MLRTDDDGPDVAAEAFARVESELVLLRGAIERESSLNLPDYSETLGRMQQELDVLAERMSAVHAVLGSSPALSVTPEVMTQRILSAGNVARRDDQAMLTTARQGLENATRVLQQIVASSRHGDERHRWLIRVGLAGILAGIVLWTVFAGFVVRAMPASWLWPERMAAHLLRDSMWGGGQRLMHAASPDAYTNLATAYQILEANREVLAKCHRRMPSSRGKINCTIRINSDITLTK